MVRSIVAQGRLVAKRRLWQVQTFNMSSDAYGSYPRPTPERAQDVVKRIEEVRQRIRGAAAKAKEVGESGKEPRLVAISKLQVPSAIMAAHIDAKQVHLGENYVQELVEKAKVLPPEIKWHFVGGLQSNKGKALAAIPNLYLLETLDSVKAANVLEKALSNNEANRTEPLRVYIQVNTSGEDAKSGVDPLLQEEEVSDKQSLVELAKHLIASCPHLHFAGLMTIGAADNSRSADSSRVQTKEDILKANPDFERLITSRRNLIQALRKDEEVKKAVVACGDAQIGKAYKEDLLGGDETGGLELSMGMSADVEIATMAGSDNVRVGSDCFGPRTSRDEATKALEEELASLKV